MASRKHFSITVPSSASSSRSASPVPSPDFRDSFVSEKREGKEDVSPGHRSTDVYDTTLPAWRAYIRRQLVKTVEKESRVIARMQVRMNHILEAKDFQFICHIATYSDTVARFVLRLLIPSRNAYVFHGHAPCFRFLRAPRDRQSVRF